jgi:phospholipase C
VTERSGTDGLKSELDRFDYVVVLMMENRSFDNLLGYLYEPDAIPRGQRFEGVAGKSLSNPIPPSAPDAGRQVVPVAQGTVMDNPNPDPGEEYPHVNTQLYGTVLPAENWDRSALQTAAPYNLPVPVPAPAPMTGFVADYINEFQRSHGRAPSYDEYRVIMECFPPDAVPVISTLAREFAVCDHWFSEVPSQTFCNRSFFHAASSSGAVVNAPYAHWVTENRAETIFNRIESLNQRGLSWRVYYDPADVFSLTGLIHYAQLSPHYTTHFFTMERFYEDARSGHLPAYTFIEPRLFLNHNDQHPPVRILGREQASSVLTGELLIHQVYEAIRTSESPQGNHYQNTLLVITYDEHGGCYDHVSPPPAPPPDPTSPVGQMGFRFDRLGVRVPAVLVSAYIEPGTVINTPLHHTSLLKTMSEKWDLGSLTRRDGSARDLREAFNRSTPRERAAWPVTTPRPCPGQKEVNNRDHPLNALQASIVGLAIAIGFDPGFSPSEIRTVYDAIRFMREQLGKKGIPVTSQGP